MKCVRRPWRPRTGGRRESDRAVRERWQQTMHGRPAPPPVPPTTTDARIQGHGVLCVGLRGQTDAGGATAGPQRTRLGPAAADRTRVYSGCVARSCLFTLRDGIFFLSRSLFSLSRLKLSANSNRRKCICNWRSMQRTANTARRRESRSPSAAPALLARTSTLRFGLVTLYSVAPLLAR